MRIAFLFSAMHHFVQELRGLCWTVEYVSLDAPDNRGSLTVRLGEAIARYWPEHVGVTEPGEWRVWHRQAYWVRAVRAALEHTAGRTLPVPDSRLRALVGGAHGVHLAHNIMVTCKGFLLRRDSLAVVRPGLATGPDGLVI